MNNSQLAILKNKITTTPALAALGQDYQAIADALNAQPHVPNPTPRANVPKRLTLTDFLAAITPQEAFGLVAYPWLMDKIEAATATNDRAAMGTLFALVSANLSANSKTAIGALLAQAEPNPNWSETVAGDSIATTLGLPRVSASDVQQVI